MCRNDVKLSLNFGKYLMSPNLELLIPDRHLFLLLLIYGLKQALRGKAVKLSNNIFQANA